MARYMLPTYHQHPLGSKKIESKKEIKKLKHAEPTNLPYYLLLQNPMRKISKLV